MDPEPRLCLTSYFPVSAEKFLTRMTSAAKGKPAERIRILVFAEADGPDLRFRVEYQAITGSKVVLRAVRKFNGADYRRELENSDHEVPDDLGRMMESEVREQVEEVSAQLRASGLEVEVEGSGP